MPENHKPLAASRGLRLALPLLLAAVAPAAAQPDVRSSLPSVRGSDAPSVRFESFGLTDGLAQGSVYRMIQDRHGFIWFGTQGGLHRFDGQEFEVYSPVAFDTTSIAEDWIWNLTEADDGAIWTAGQAGSVSRLDPATGRFDNYLPDPADSTKLPGGSAFDVLEARDGTIWVATGRGLARMDPSEPGVFTSMIHVHGDSTTIPGWVHFLHEDADGMIWGGTNNGIIRVDPGSGGITSFWKEGDTHGGTADPQSYFEMLPDADDERVLWIGTGRGLARFDTRTGSLERYLAFPQDPPGLRRNTHFSVSADPVDPEILWVASQGAGLLRFDRAARTFTQYTSDSEDPNSLPDDQVLTVFADRSGMMWVGTTGMGLAKFNPGSVRIGHVGHDADDPDALAKGGNLWALMSDSRGRLWAGQTDALGRNLVAIYDPGTGRVDHLRPVPDDPSSIFPGTVGSILEDAEGRVWVGSGGLASCDPATLRCRQYPPSVEDSTRLGPGTVQALYQSPADPRSIWVGSGRSGLQKLDITSGRVTRFFVGDPDEGKGPDFVAHIIQDAEGTFWLGTWFRGLVRFDEGTGAFRTFSYDPRDTTSVAFDQIEVVIQRPDEPGVLWLATQAGIDRFDIATGTARHFGTDKGLADGKVYGMLLDDEGTLWVSTNKGISSFDPESGKYRNYGLDDGLRALEFQQNGFARGRDGMLYFADVAGITAFHPSQLSTNPVAPELAFTALRVAGHAVAPEPGGILEKTIAVTESITLPYAQNEFAVDFVALHFSDPARNRFSYRLAGLSDEWVDAGFQRTAAYGNLPPGEYTLQVRAANPDGVWNEEGISLGVTVLPPWWRTTWAYVLFAVLLAGLVFGVDRLQRYRLLRTERERSAIQEAELRAETAEAEAKALQAENDRKKNIERLSEIGAEITSSLDVETIFGRLYEHVNELTDAPIFGVGIYHEDRQVIDYRMAIENGKRYAPYTRDTSEKDQFPVWCIEHRKPVFINDVESDYSKYIGHYEHETGKLEDGTTSRSPISLIYLPLVTQDRVLGVITVQSFRKNAYTEDDLNILRTMAAYASVAIDNANAYRRLNGTVAELQQTQQQLVQQEKMASLGQLTAGIAHEIKNPLNFVNNFADLNAEMATELRELLAGADSAELASKRAELDDLVATLQTNARQIAKHGRRADEIVKGMMQHARPGDAERYPVAVNDFVDEYLNVAWHGQRAQFPDLDVQVARDYAPDVGNATLVPQDMGRVVVNLVGNAFDVLRGREGAHLRVSTARRGGMVEIRVSDNGPGVPDTIRSRIFEPFFTTKPSGQGTGLGLSMAHDIVTQGHGGTMRVENNAEGGATFVVALPV
jgi:signal transduction histidine kinase/ligand-binding sensor domain-containing protein